jgi:hypothetical protein
MLTHPRLLALASRVAALTLPAVGAAAAQSAEPRVTQAFASALIWSAGPRFYGARQATRVDQIKFSTGPAFEARLQHPLSRRTGFMTGVQLAPQAKQERMGSDGTSLNPGAKAPLASLDAGLAARLKPGAPVYGYVGAGALVATKGPDPLDSASGTHVEPQGTFGVGFDSHPGRRVGLRIVYAGFVSKPKSSSVADILETKTIAYDWTIMLGARVGFHRSEAAQ